MEAASADSSWGEMSQPGAVDLGLCFGWSSGQRKTFDGIYYLQKYVPRRARSRWSQINVAKVAVLTAAKRMRPSGLAEVEAARADGRWGKAIKTLEVC